MRDFIIISVLCLLAAFVADAVWTKGKYFSAFRQDLASSFSAIRHR